MRAALKYAVGSAACLLACWTAPPLPPEPQVVCGDGVKVDTELCDNGPENSDTKPGACRTTCKPAGCGDTVVDPGEACDDGNRTAGDGCAASCAKIERCGDGIIDAVTEQCDDGVNNSDTLANRCRSDCKRARCGDFVEDTAEECDDGNLQSGDSCDSNCTVPRCGNGIVGAGEECDDQNTFNTDSCLPDCRANRCSRGVDASGNRCFLIGTYPVQDSELRAVEIADLDSDGWSDIVVLDRDDDHVKVFWNVAGTGFIRTEHWVAQFYSVTGDDPVDLAIGDINGDGKLDLATANEGKDLVCMLENKGNRSFARHFFGVPGQPTDLTLANVDGTPGLEVIVGLDNDDQVRMYRLNGFTSYGMPQAISSSSPTSLTSGDADGDGDPDVAWTTGSPAFAVNEGGNLAKLSVANGQSRTSPVKLWDLDGTPPAELVTGVSGFLVSTGHLRVFSNSDTTNGTVFDTYADTPTKKWPVYLARFGSSVVYADNGGTFSVLSNDQGTLGNEQPFTYDGDAKGMAAGDLNNDGMVDVVIISGDRKSVLLFRGSP
jgi:cysteine-rich repeat protein